MLLPWGPAGVARRMVTHWLVLGAAALTTLVAATVAAALAVFAGQALPQVVHDNLAKAQGTSLSVTALVSSPGQAAAGGAVLRSRIAATMPGVPISFDSALWSDPLDLVPQALPASPSGAGPGNTPLLQAAALNAVASHATLVAGHWPAAAPGPRQAVQAALPAPAAALLHVSAGDVLRLRDRITGAPVSFDVTGIFRPRPAGSYWQLSYIPAGGASPGSGSTTYGPLVVSQAAFGSALTTFSGSWVAQPDLIAFQEGDLGPVSARLAAFTSSLPDAAFLNGAQAVTNLPSVLAGAASNLTVARSTLVISALELLVLAITALLGVARLLGVQREAETALLTARGATRSQLSWLTAAEVIPLAALASVAGGLAGIRLASVLATAGPLRGAGLRLAGAPGTWPDAIEAAVTVAAVAAAALLVPGLTSSATAVRARRGRQARIAGVARAGLDAALLVLAVLAGWQLRYYSAASSNGTAGIDPVLALAPALALAGGSVATLRLLPLAARAADWLAARGRRFTVSLAWWQFGRMPVRQGSSALLLTMAVATGTLALAQHASWSRSVADQAAFANGAAVQADPAGPLSAAGVRALTTATGVTHAMAVSVDPQAYPGEVIALDASQAAQVVQIRGDQTPRPQASLFRAITPPGRGQQTLPGTVLTGPQPGARPGTIRLTAALGPAGLASGLGPVPVSLTVLDATGGAYQVPVGSVTPDGRPHLLVASLGRGPVSYPLRVVSLTAAFLLPRELIPGGVTLTISGLSLAGWTETVTSDLPPQPPGSVSQPPVAEQTSFPDGTSTFGFNPGNTVPGVPPNHGDLVLQPPAAGPRTIPAIATKSFMDAESLVVGDTVTASLNGPQVSMHIVAEVPSFPTVTGPQGALIADLSSLQESVARQGFAPLAVNQWWLATAGGGVPPALTASLPAGTAITTTAELAAAGAGDTLSAAPQLALVAMAVAVALLAVTGFWVSIAADVRRRRGETALLAALGVTQRGAAGALGLEKLLVSLPAAVLGFLLGAFLADLLVPAVTLSPAARQPVPSPITVYDLPQAIPLALAVAVLPAVFAALAALGRPDPAAELRAAEAG
jgi:hypothetical protein